MSLDRTRADHPAGGSIRGHRGAAQTGSVVGDTTIALTAVAAASVVNLHTHRVLTTVNTGWQGQVAIHLARNDTRAYLATPRLDYLTVLNTKTLKVSGHIDVGTGALDIATADTARGERAYVSEKNTSRLTVIDTKTDKVVGHVALRGASANMITAPTGRDLWVSSQSTDRIWVVDGTKVVRTITTPSQIGPAQATAFSPDGRSVLMSGLGGIATLNVATGKWSHLIGANALFPHTADIDLGTVAFNRAGTAALVVNSTFPDSPGRGSVRVIDTRAFHLGAMIGTGVEPWGLGVDTGTNTAYVANYLSDTLTWFHIPAPAHP